MGIRRVPGHILATKLYPGKYGHQMGARAHEHQNGARAHIDTEMVLYNIQITKGCLGKYEHKSGARAHMGTGMVPGHL